jgi:hypothetical protein
LDSANFLIYLSRKWNSISLRNKEDIDSKVWDSRHFSYTQLSYTVWILFIFLKRNWNVCYNNLYDILSKKIKVDKRYKYTCFKKLMIWIRCLHIFCLLKYIVIYWNYSNWELRWLFLLKLERFMSHLLL